MFFVHSEIEMQKKKKKKLKRAWQMMLEKPSPGLQL